MTLFRLILALATFGAAAASLARTHCFVIVGEGGYADPLYPEASLLLRNAPLRGRCQEFRTWDDLINHLSREARGFDATDQIFIAQAVHGAPGGRAMDRVGRIPPDRLDLIDHRTTVEDLGGTSPSKIVSVLKQLAQRHRVAFHDMSCHGGSLLTRYLQQSDASDDPDETQARLCIVTDSIQGSVTVVRQNLGNLPAVDFTGRSMTEVFAMDVPVGPHARGGLLGIAVFTGLISGAKMSMLPEHAHCVSMWEGEQRPMVIHHPRGSRNWTGAYQALEFDMAFGRKPVPIWGHDWSIERIYRALSEQDLEAARGWSSLQRNPPNLAAVESLRLPLHALTPAQRLRRRACDDFRF